MARLARFPALTAAIAAYAAGFAALSILRDRAFATGRFDLGNMVQAVWSTAHGDPLRVTNLAGEQVSRLGAHTDVLLVLFAPLWWIWPSAAMLLVVQATAIALGGLPVFWLARKHLGSDRSGLGFALAYLLYPATTWLTLNEFHPVAFATPALLYAFWFLDEDRLVPFTVFAVIAAASKEEVAVVVAGYGVWYALARGRRVAGAAIAGSGLLWCAVAFAVVIPHFNGGRSAFAGRYSEVGGSPGGIAHTALRDPGLLLHTAVDHGALHYLLDLVLPLAGLCLLSPIALAALPEIVINVLSSAPTQRSIHFHYTAAEIPPLVIAAVLGAARVAPRWRIPVATVVVLTALAGNYRLGAIPFWRELPGGQTLQSRAAVVTEHDLVAAGALRLIPATAVVSATNSLGGHLSARRRILSFPYLQDATWIAADETKPSYADRIAPVAAATQLAWVRRNPAWRLVFEQDGVLVFHRVLPP